MNTNDVRGAIRKVLDDSQFTYTLGFYPDPDSQRLGSVVIPLVKKRG